MILFSSSCPVKKKFLTVTNTCNLVKAINQPTTVSTVLTVKGTDHIHPVQLCTRESSQNVTVLSRGAKVPKAFSQKIHKSNVYCSFSIHLQIGFSVYLVWQLGLQLTTPWIGFVQIYMGEMGRYLNLVFLHHNVRETPDELIAILLLTFMHLYMCACSHVETWCRRSLRFIGMLFLLACNFSWSTGLLQWFHLEIMYTLTENNACTGLYGGWVLNSGAHYECR